nr:enoyl-CoA hydratase/isomerase family protein [Desulfobacterales bacterium]
MSLVLFKRDGDILRVSLNRTSVLNAINIQILKELEQGLSEYIDDNTLKGLVLFGEGRCFASGADIKEIASLDEKGIRNFHNLRERTFSLLERFPSPTLAMIERYALGSGLELALCCDFRIASEDAQLGVPSARLGIVESFEYISRLVRAVGPFQAKKLILTGERIDARTAFNIGLVEEVVPPDELLERTESLLAKIAINSVYSMRESKEVIDMCVRDPNLFYIRDTALPMVESLSTDDFKEGTRAFIEKREAKFK